MKRVRALIFLLTVVIVPYFTLPGVTACVAQEVPAQTITDIPMVFPTLRSPPSKVAHGLSDSGFGNQAVVVPETISVPKLRASNPETPSDMPSPSTEAANVAAATVPGLGNPPGENGLGSIRLPTLTPLVIPTLPVESTPLPDVPWPDQVSALKYDLQTTSYSIDQTPANRMALVAAADQLINSHCLEISPNRGFERSNKPRCNELVAKTLMLDSQDPAAICARDGMSASLCWQAYESVSAAPLGSDSPAVQNKDVESFINANTPEDTSKVENAMRDHAYEYSRAPNSVKKEALVTEFHNTVSKYCIPLAYEIDFSAVNGPNTTPTPLPKNLAQKPFANVVADLAKKPSERGTPVPTITHRRLFSAACVSVAEQVRKAFPDSYILTCVNRGFYSPQCQKDYKAQNVKPRSNSASSGSSHDGLGKF